MMRPAITLLIIGSLAGAARATTGRDLRGCYGFSDTFPPITTDAPVTEFIDISASGTRLTLTDDAVSAPIPLGFTFDFFGRPQTQVSVSANGFLTFADVPPPSSGCLCQPTDLPDARTPNGLVAGLWKDLNPGFGGAVYYQTVGFAPSRRFIVEFSAVPGFLNAAMLSTFEIVLSETSDEIVVQYPQGIAGSDGPRRRGGHRRELRPHLAGADLFAGPGRGQVRAAPHRHGPRRRHGLHRQLPARGQSGSDRQRWRRYRGRLRSRRPRVHGGRRASMAAHPTSRSTRPETPSWFGMARSAATTSASPLAGTTRKTSRSRPPSR